MASSSRCAPGSPTSAWRESTARAAARFPRAPGTVPRARREDPVRSVSIVVPAYNEADLLPACLASLLVQDYAGPIEILVVDNASTDDTAAIARAHGVRVLDEPVRGYGRALRRGFAAAAGDVIAAT